MKNNQKLKVKKNITLNSLEAAICNVALFKAIKQKQFKDTIFISYNQKGVMLQAITQKQWNKANQYILSFIKNKKIELLTYGHDKEQYQQVINKDLKQYTKQMKERQQECPYINLIHYQRLRKSCEYMDKQKYVEPLQAWQKKNKMTPNFAYLVVEPKQKFESVKIAILEMLKGHQMTIKTEQLKPKDFLHLFYNSQYSSKLRDLFDKKQLQIKINTDKIIITIYSDFTFQNISKVKVVQQNKKILKFGYHIIKKQTILKQIQETKEWFSQEQKIFKQMHEKYIKKYLQNYCFIVYPKDQQTILCNKIQALRAQQDSTFIKQSIKKQVVCSYSQFHIIQKNYSNYNYTSYTAIINQCYMTIHEYILKDEDLQSFKLYLEQLQKYYNSSLVRYYGISIVQNNYYLIFDYKQKSLDTIIKNFQIIDQIQVATIIIDILYSINFLHTHEQPRCYGILDKKTIYWPMTMILPYLRDSDEELYSFQNDIKMIGLLFNELVPQANEQIEAVIGEMLQENNFKRIKLGELILKLEDIINK